MPLKLNWQNPKWDFAAAALLSLLSAGASFYLGSSPVANLAPLGFSAAVLFAGRRHGAKPALLFGLAAGLWTAGLFFSGILSAHACLACFGCLGASILFPLPWTRGQKEFQAAFEGRRQPWAEKRDFAISQLSKIGREVQVSEQRGRETDALYHAGREISKLLSLQDTLEFSREVIADTLLGSAVPREKAAGPGPQPAPNEPCFVLVLVDEEAGRFRLGTFSGLELELAERFETPLGGQDLMNWLKAQGQPLVIANAASEARLKGIALPPQLRGFSSVPLLIQSQVIGLVVVFDMGNSPRLDTQDLANLRILASQIAIGVEKAMLYDKVQRLSITDGLTGLFVHRHFQSRLEEEMRRAERYKEPLGLLMLDIDFFKKYNDNYGHLAGDAVLKRVAALIRNNIESADFAARYGGEEFSVILPKQDKAASLAKAEKIRKAVEADSFNFEGISAKVTVSVGLAAFPEDGMIKKGVLDAADRALYKAKHDGRNRVEQADGDDPQGGP